MQQDSHPGHAVDPLSHVNKYGCANNNPLNYYDPNGRLPQIVVAALIALAQVVIETAFMEGNYWENFNNAFDSPTKGEGHGSFWINFGLNLTAGHYFNADIGSLKYISGALTMTTAGAFLDWITDEKGYHWEGPIKGVKIGHIKDLFYTLKYAVGAKIIYAQRDYAYVRFVTDYYKITGAMSPWF